MGCYRDKPDENRAFPFKLLTHYYMNAAMCYNLAVAGGFTFFGTQHYDECWAGNNESRATMHGVSDCNTPCRNPSTEMCGGGLVNSLYRVIQTTAGEVCTAAAACMPAYIRAD
jgi:hypothetical protein